MFFDDHSSGHAGLFVGRFAIASAAAKKAKSKFNHAGQKCLALRDDGTVCGSVISAHNALPLASLPIVQQEECPARPQEAADAGGC